jgi:hypothetical protein
MKIQVARMSKDTWPSGWMATYCGVCGTGKSKEDAVDNLTSRLDEISSCWFKGKTTDIEEIPYGE